VRDLADGLTDFMETAGAMMAMDLIVCVDTAAAHVAGALGRPTLVLLPFTPSFRWQLNRRDYAWYPTMTVFTQTTPGVWKDPVDEVRREVSERARVVGAARQARAS
jgi:ADP-heptose:LPS heptosyltransferase